MKDVSFSKWNEIAMQKTDFHVLELFLRAKNTNAVRAKNTNAVLVQLSKWRECKATDAEKFFSVRERC